MCSRAHCSTSAVRQIGPIARRAMGCGKSFLVVYRLAVLFVTPNIAAISARPAS